MKMRAGILRVLAMLLLLVFVQKTGVGLYLHHLLHGQAANGQTAIPDEKGKEISYACSCLDDLQMPYLPAGIDTPDPLPLVHAEPVAFYSVTLPVVTDTHTSLRGPPASFVSLLA